MSAGRGPADPSAKNIWCDAKDHARPRKYLEQNIFSKRGVQVEHGKQTASGGDAGVEAAPDRSPNETPIRKARPVQSAWRSPPRRYYTTKSHCRCRLSSS